MGNYISVDAKYPSAFAFILVFIGRTNEKSLGTCELNDTHSLFPLPEPMILQQINRKKQ
jgi:hypothetical protein